MMEIKVPGSWAPAVAVLDLETVKVPTGGFVMANGEALRNRWSVAMAGIGYRGKITIVEYQGSEESRLAIIGDELENAAEVRYAATREFDEMICRGRFTNARRAHESLPFYPAVPGANRLPWRNLGKLPAYQRGGDIASKDVPAVLAAPSYLREYGPYSMEPVLVHLLRDVCELIIASDPSPSCKAWCEDILADYGCALSALF